MGSLNNYAHKNFIRIRSIVSMFLIILIIFNNYFTFGSARNEEVPGYHNYDKVSGLEGCVTYDFPLNIRINFSANVDVDLDIVLDSEISDMNFEIDILAQKDIRFKIENSKFTDFFSEDTYKVDNIKYQNIWNALFILTTNTSVDEIRISTLILNHKNVNQNDIWASYNTVEEKWEFLESYYNESNGYLSVIINDPQNVSILTLFESEQISFLPLIISVSIIAIFTISVFFAISKKEYRQFIKNRIFNEQTGAHRLSIEEVLENENRSKILDLILDQPGIHFNEIQRITELTGGNLVWHLDILTTYKVIGKKNIGQYLVYFPYFDSNPMSNIDFKMAKSKETLKILDIIEHFPGTYGSAIAKILKIDHKTAKYHIDKLLKAELVKIEKDGRKSLLYPVIGNLKELHIDRDSLLLGKPESEA